MIAAKQDGYQLEEYIHIAIFTKTAIMVHIRRKGDRMSEFRRVDIDLEINKLIERERRSFSETDNAILRRLLKLDSLPSAASAPSAGNGADHRPWRSKGVELPHGTLLRMSYRGREYRGEIRDGTWDVEGRVFHSPSAAAGGCAKTKDGASPSLDGWRYWEIKRPSDRGWGPLGALRSS